MTNASLEQASPSRAPLPVQAKLKIGAVDDPLEREADDIADHVMRMPDPGRPLLQRCPGGCPGDEDQSGDDETPVIRRSIDTMLPARDGTPQMDASTETAIRCRLGNGSPLPRGVRDFAERRIGADFSRVRLHADADAADLTRRVNARAFTVGSDIFVGRDDRSGATDSRRVLVHELTHVVQQHAVPWWAGTRSHRKTPGSGPPVVRRQPLDAAESSGTATSWITPAIDAFAAGAAPPDPDEPYGPAARVQDLFFAIINLHAALRKALAAGGGITEEHKQLANAVADALSWSLAGFPMAVAEELAHGLVLLGGPDSADQVWQAARAADNPPHARSDDAARAEFLRGIIKTWGGPPDHPAAALNRAVVIVHTLEAVARQHATLNPMRGESERERERGIVSTQIEVLVHLFAHVQVVIDHIVAATHPDPRGALDVLETLLSAAGTACEPIWHEELAIIVADFASDPAVLKDFFEPEDTSREVAVEFYEEGPEPGSAAGGLHAEVGTAIEVRQRQIGILRELADQGLVSVGQETVHPLSSDDALRAWTLQRFETLKIDKGRAKALSALVSELDALFEAFTIQSKQNIREDDVPLINASFPRAATGELIHDCGVYAMRVVYALSLLARHLGLRFYLARLPLHVAVVITGSAELRVPDATEDPVVGDEVPLFVVHSGRFLTARNQPPGEDLASDIGELAAATFIPHLVVPVTEGDGGRAPAAVDVPYRVQEVLAPGNQDWLQQAFQRLWVLIPEPEDDRHVGETAYLNLLEAYRRFHNDGLRPLSAVVCTGWAQVEQSSDSLERALGPHLAAVEESFAGVDALIEEFRVASDKLQSALQDPSFRTTWGTVMASAEDLTFSDWMRYHEIYTDYLAQLRETAMLLDMEHVSKEEAVERLRIVGVTVDCSPLDPLR